MPRVVRHWISKTEIDDKSQRDSSVKDTLHLITDERLPWSVIRRLSVVPKFGGEHTQEPGFFLESMRPAHMKPLYWEVGLEYIPFRIEQIDPSPLARPADITWSTSLIEEPTSWDNKRRPICTTAGEMITGVNLQRPLVEYSITKNLPGDPDWIHTHFGAVNADVVRLRGREWKPKTLLVISGGGGPFAVENKTRFTEIKLSLLGDARGWTKEVWNRGTVRLARETRTKWTWRGNIPHSERVEVWVQVPIMAGEPPAPVEEPQFLDYSGQEVVDHLSTERGATVKPDKLIVLRFDVQPELKFNGVLPLV